MTRKKNNIYSAIDQVFGGCIEGSSRIVSSPLDYTGSKFGYTACKKNTSAELRFAIHVLLSGEWEALCAFFAIVCSSYVPVNRASTGRSIMTPLGNQDFIPVRKSNKLTSRRGWYGLECFEIMKTNYTFLGLTRSQEKQLVLTIDNALTPPKWI